MTANRPLPLRPAGWLAALALLLAGCRAGGDAFVGRWHAPDEQVDFLQDGRLLLRRSGGAVAGQYDVVEPRRMRVRFDGTDPGRPPEDWSVDLRGDSLTVCETDRPSQCVRYVRVPPGTPPPFAVPPSAP